MDGSDDEEGEEEDMEHDITVGDDGLLTKAELNHVKEESKRALGEKLKRLKRDDDDELKLIVKESNKSKQAQKEQVEHELKLREEQDRAAEEAKRSKEAFEAQKKKEQELKEQDEERLAKRAEKKALKMEVKQKKR